MKFTKYAHLAKFANLTVLILNRKIIDWQVEVIDIIIYLLLFSIRKRAIFHKINSCFIKNI